MQLVLSQFVRPLAGAIAVLLFSLGGAAAQSLSPMHANGPTPSDIKAFRLLVGNPYKTRMVFIITPMDPGFTIAATDAAVNFPRIRLAPGATRPVIAQFRIAPGQKERTIGICVIPEGLEGSVLPRVCGTYTGRRAGTGG